MKRFVILGALIFGGIALLLAVAGKGGSVSITVQRDLVFGKGGDTPLKLDLAMPKSGDGPFPALMFIHGPGWRAGTRQDMNHFIEGVARLGYVGVTPDYRLVPA